jgi:hypothetical protein
MTAAPASALAAHKFTAATTVLSAANSPSASAANCSRPALSSPFAAYGDSNLYALVPGETFDSVSGTGWTFTGSASLKTATLADGSTGQVLDLPAGSTAVSPPMCVDYTFPTARMMVQPVSQGAPLSIFAGYAATGNLVSAGNVKGHGSGWQPSAVLQTNPGSQPGWQLVQFALIAGTTGHNQVYNLYVDPRMHY